MAAATKKITLSSSRDIPFNKLVLSQANVRRIKAGVSIEELAEDISRRTLLQSLNVRAVLDEDGHETGMYEIPAGGRRYRALELLVKQKRLAKTALVPCVVREGGIAEEDSLAENVQRAPLHPLDQFRAFHDLRQKGQSEEEIAAAFFVSVTVVKQRLRLASVSETLLAAYAEDAMTLDQLMAFTVSTDHARQEQVWEAIQNSWSKEPYQIRRMLTENKVRASDKRVQFIGEAACEAAGGVVMRDLFQSDDGGWIEDVALLDKLVADKLRIMADEIAAEGWKWVEAAVSLPYDAAYGLRELAGTPKAVSTEEQAAFDAVQAEYARLSEEYEDADELPDEVDARFGELETAITAFEDRPVIYDPAEIARAGAFVSIDNDGTLRIDRGFVRPDDEAPATDEGESEAGSASGGTGPDGATAAVQRTVVTIGGESSEPEDEEEGDAVKPLPDRLLVELTAHRTLALRDALASNPHVAMTALLHKLVTDAFHQRAATGCLEASIRHVFFPAQPDDLKDSASARSVTERHEAWSHDLPADDDALWDCISGLDEASRMALLAHCVSFGLNALYEKPNPYGGNGVSRSGLNRRLAQADRLAWVVGLDMVEAGWRPTVGNYLGRVTKQRIIEAVREAKGEQASQLIDHLKKGEMASEAERLLDGTGWLPEPLRRIDVATASTIAGEDGSDALPEFLAGGDDEAAAQSEDDEPHMAAAE